jgi:CheY-like chemotaxis protein
MPETIQILLIEDDHDDITFFKDALQDNGVAFKLETLTRGDLITGYLQNENKLPDLIVMDLNLPKLHGREVLCKIKDDKRFKGIPLIVLTTSSLVEDQQYCLEKGADHFVSKPSSPEGFKRLSELITGAVKSSRLTRP